MAGFYATPEDQVPRIAALLQLEEYDDEAYENVRLSVVDFCAGEGAAVEQVTRILTRPVVRAKWRRKDAARRESAEKALARWRDRALAEGREFTEEAPPPATPVTPEEVEVDLATGEVPADIYTVEMEKSRYVVLSERSGLDYRSHGRALHGDAFCVTFAPAKDSGVGLQWLNPPYDLDKVCGRLEERFLRRFTDAIAPGGVLVFIVPYYALAASADTFARRYEDLACYRFAGSAFDDFKQVVVFAKKLAVDRIEPDPEILDLVIRWSKDGPKCPELPDADRPHRRPRYVVPMHDRHTEALKDWKVKVVDVKGILAKHVPWRESVRGGRVVPLGRVVPEFPLAECMHRTYEVATPPRPAHIAAGLAAGLFNGQRIEPDDPGSGLPALLVKGVFDREWRTVEEKHNKEGEKSGEVQVQAPKLVVTILDLRDHCYYTVAGGDGKAKAVVERPTLSEVPGEEESAVALVARKLVEARTALADAEERREDNSQRWYRNEISRSEYRLLDEPLSEEVSRLKARVGVLEEDANKAPRWDAIAEMEKSRAARGARCDVSKLTISDMLCWYGRALMGVMERQCVVLYDPRRDAGKYALVPSAQPLYDAQAHAARGIITVLLDRGHVRQPTFDGEVGVGKTRTVEVAARSYLRAVGCRREGRLLVTCPPHLLDSWRDETMAVFPDADYRVLTSISEVDAVRDADPDRFLVAVLSRSKSKLSHRYEGVVWRCPRCGAMAPEDAEETARKRLRCEAHEVWPENVYARYAADLAARLRPWVSSRYLPRRMSEKVVDRRFAAVGKKRTEEVLAYDGLPSDLIAAIRSTLVEDCKHAGYEAPQKKALAWALAAGGASPEVVLDVVRRLKPDHYDYQHFAESLLLFLPAGGALGMAFEMVETFPKGGYGTSPAEWFKAAYAKVEADDDEVSARVCNFRIGRDERGLTLDGVAFGSVEAADRLLHAVGSMGTWSRGPDCGEPLYQAVPKPPIYPLAKYIGRHHKNTFDYLVVDESHEANNEGTAQEVATHQLTALRLPTTLMTGTLMSGYAESLFSNWWATDLDFRQEFDRGAVSAFVDRYGYRKRLVTDKEDGKVVAFGSCSDRVERSERDIGSAPGVHPLFIFRHLLPGTVTLQKEDLRMNIPRLTMERVEVAAEGDLFDEYDAMVKELVQQIKKDRFDEEKAGKLFGQLVEVASYLDRATEDVGNGCGSSHFEVRYPESVGGGLVAQARLFPASTVLPKEARMLDVIEEELREGRRVMVFGWHLNLLPRLSRLLRERLGEDVPILYADKVPTGKRQAWIDAKIVKKRVRCMVVNPVCVKTGLNNLRYFHSIWQQENPGCNPEVDRQSIGRIDRIGQDKETHVHRAYYGGTLQEKMYKLLLDKVAISTATDGLDSTAALMAAGANPDSFLAGLSIGKELWKMYESDLNSIAFEERPRLRVVTGGRRR